MKVKIEADGGPFGTRIFYEGFDISNNFTSVVWKQRAGESPEVELQASFVALVFVGEILAKVLGPGGKEVRKIEYADGTVEVFPE